MSSLSEEALQLSDYFATLARLEGNTKVIISYRLSELVQTGDGIGIIESGLSLGGGYL